MKRILTMAILLLVCAATARAHWCEKPDGTGGNYPTCPAGYVQKDPAGPTPAQARAIGLATAAPAVVWANSGRATLAQAKTCVDTWRPALRDPESAHLLTENAPGLLLHGGSRTVLVAEGRARNGFNGLDQQFFLCDVNEHGEVLGDPFGDLSDKAASVAKHGFMFAFPGAE